MGGMHESFLFFFLYCPSDFNRGKEGVRVLFGVLIHLGPLLHTHPSLAGYVTFGLEQS